MTFSFEATVEFGTMKDIFWLPERANLWILYKSMDSAVLVRLILPSFFKVTLILDVLETFIAVSAPNPFTKAEVKLIKLICLFVSDAFVMFKVLKIMYP